MTEKLCAEGEKIPASAKTIYRADREFSPRLVLFLGIRGLW